MTTRPTHTDCLNTLFGLRRFGIKLGLATIRRILANLGNPHRRYRTIHVAGTNGKGSVASGIASVLRASGYRVGLYTSPHLVRFNERIQVDGAEITDADIVRLYRRVKRALPGGREPTFFEFTTAMALDEFARYNVGYHVWPYWREYVQGTCARLGIPPVPVPMYRIPASDPEADTVRE